MNPILRYLFGRFAETTAACVVENFLTILIDMWNFCVREFRIPIDIIDFDMITNSREASTMYESEDFLGNVQGANTDLIDIQTHFGYDMSLLDTVLEMNYQLDPILEPIRIEPSVSFDLINLQTEAFKEELNFSTPGTFKNDIFDLLEEPVVSTAKRSPYTDCMHSAEYNVYKMSLLHSSNTSLKDCFVDTANIACKNTENILGDEDVEKYQNNDSTLGNKLYREVLQTFDSESAKCSINCTLKPIEEATENVPLDSRKEKPIIDFEETPNILKTIQGNKGLKNGENFRDMLNLLNTESHDVIVECGSEFEEFEGSINELFSMYSCDILKESKNRTKKCFEKLENNKRNNISEYVEIQETLEYELSNSKCDDCLKCKILKTKSILETSNRNEVLECVESMIETVELCDLVLENVANKTESQFPVIYKASSNDFSIPSDSNNSKHNPDQRKNEDFSNLKTTLNDSYSKLEISECFNCNPAMNNNKNINDKIEGDLFSCKSIKVEQNAPNADNLICLLKHQNKPPEVQRTFILEDSYEVDQGDIIIIHEDVKSNDSLGFDFPASTQSMINLQAPDESLELIPVKEYPDIDNQECIQKYYLSNRTSLSVRSNFDSSEDFDDQDSEIASECAKEIICKLDKNCFDVQKDAEQHLNLLDIHNSFQEASPKPEAEIKDENKNPDYENHSSEGYSVTHGTKFHSDELLENINDSCNFKSEKLLRHLSKRGEFQSTTKINHGNAKQCSFVKFKSLEELSGYFKQKMFPKKESKAPSRETNTQESDKRGNQYDCKLHSYNLQVLEGDHFIQHEKYIPREEFQNEYKVITSIFKTDITNKTEKGHSNSNKDINAKLDCSDTAFEMMKKNSNKMESCSSEVYNTQIKEKKPLCNEFQKENVGKQQHSGSSESSANFIDISLHSSDPVNNYGSQEVFNQHLRKLLDIKDDPKVDTENISDSDSELEIKPKISKKPSFIRHLSQRWRKMKLNPTSMISKFKNKSRKKK